QGRLFFRAGIQVVAFDGGRGYIESDGRDTALTRQATEEAGVRAHVPYGSRTRLFQVLDDDLPFLFKSGRGVVGVLIVVGPLRPGGLPGHFGDAALQVIYQP